MLGVRGEMEYLKRRDETGVLLRTSVQVPMPWARSVVVCALNYNAGGPLSIDDAETGTGWIGRYAWSGRAVDPNDAIGVIAGLRATDYHEELLGRLRYMEAALLERVTCRTPMLC